MTSQAGDNVFLPLHGPLAGSAEGGSAPGAGLDRTTSMPAPGLGGASVSAKGRPGSVGTWLTPAAATPYKRGGAVEEEENEEEGEGVAGAGADPVQLPVTEIILNRGRTGLGFNIVGGSDEPYINADPGIYVSTIRGDGAAAADGRLQIGDRIVSVNGKSVVGRPHLEAVKIFKLAGDTVVLKVQHGAEKAMKDGYALTSNSNSSLYITAGAIGVAAVATMVYIYYKNKYKK